MECIDCQDEATRWIGWEGRTEGPYPACDMCTHHTVKNRNGVDIGPYIESNKPFIKGGRWVMKCTSHHFTFGTDQVITYKGISHVGDYWVTVTLPEGSEVAHRQVFMDEFTSKYCSRPTQFAFEYSDEEFVHGPFTKGQLLEISHARH